jgi:Bacterial protein of unknown function (DUF899)
MMKHKVATREEWLAARNQLLAKEKELTRRGDQLAAERRNLPWVPIEKDYRARVRHPPLRVISGRCRGQPDASRPETSGAPCVPAG